MNDKPKIDYDKIAKVLHAERRGPLHVGSGFFPAELPGVVRAKRLTGDTTRGI